MRRQRRSSSPARVAVAALPRPLVPHLTRFLPSARSLLFGFAVVAVAAAAYAVARETSMFAITRIEVSGTDARGRAEVRRALGELRGQTLLSVSGATIAGRLSALPDVAGERYDREFPHTLRIFVDPEQAAAVVRHGDRAWLVSSSGRVLRAVPRRALRALPRAWLPGSVGLQRGDALEGSPAVVVGALSHLRGTPLAGRIVGATIDRAHGLVFFLRSGAELVLGADRFVDLKLAIAVRILRLAPAGTKTIDVSVPERPVSSESQPGG